MSNAKPSKRSEAEIEALLAAEPEDSAPLTCTQLCAKRNDDLDVLDNLEDFPPKQRAAVRAFALADIRKINAQMKVQHCPACQ